VIVVDAMGVVFGWGVAAFPRGFIWKTRQSPADVVDFVLHGHVIRSFVATTTWPTN